MGEVPGGSGWGWVSPTAPLLSPLKYESPTPHHPYSTHSVRNTGICHLRPSLRSTWAWLRTHPTASWPSPTHTTGSWPSPTSSRPLARRLTLGGVRLTTGGGPVTGPGAGLRAGELPQQKHLQEGAQATHQRAEPAPAVQGREGRPPLPRCHTPLPSLPLVHPSLLAIIIIS
jgi:hypothetical protein